MRAFSGRRAGFSLVEALVTLVVIGLVALASLSALGVGLDAAHRSGRQLVAAALADRRLAELELLSRDELSALAGQERSGRFEAPYGEWAWHASVEPVAGEAELWDVAVIVDHERTGYTLRTRLHRPPPAAEAP